MPGPSSIPWVSLYALVLLAAAVRVVYLTCLRKPPKAAPNPPGPHPVPILGNIHQLPPENQQKAFYEWGQIFGDITFAKLFHTPLIVINSLDVARDLMEKRGGNYNDRPPFVLFSELMGWESTLTHLRFGERFKKHRKWMQTSFMTKVALNSYQPSQRRECYTMLAALVAKPESYVSHFTRFAAATLMDITYGHRVTTESDSFVAMAERATTETVRAGSPARMLVDFFPILKYYPTWLPGATFKTEALHVRGLVQTMMNSPYELVKREMRAGNARPSFTANLLEEHHRHGRLSLEDEVDIKGAAGTVYAAGTETTATIMVTFILAMVRHPDVYHKAQEEIDRVVGPERLPDFDDRDSLPYLNAVINEVYRWQVPVPVGIPHFTIKDDEYRGYHIPARTMVIANIWGLSQNPDVYPEPEAFRPERFLDNINEDFSDPKNYVFGFGRRLCPGKDFADSNTFLLAANILATMNVMRTRDNNGQEVIPPLDFTSGFVRRPTPFKCIIEPRSQKAIDLIHRRSVEHAG